MGTLREILKIPSPSKTIESRPLNQLGLQTFRTVAAHLLYKMRGRSDNALAMQLYENGVVHVPNFLPNDHLEELTREAVRALKSDVRRDRHDHGASELEQIRLSDLKAEDYPAIHAFYSHPVIGCLFGAAERRKVDIRRYLCCVERLTVRHAEQMDREASLHVDTFFNNHKCWLLLSDVGPNDPAFVYVPRSNHLTLERLRHIYSESRGANQGSRRIREEELQRSGLVEQQFRVAKGTLVMANTFGFHRREPGAEGTSRLALHVSVRANPFLPGAVHDASVARWLAHVVR